MVETTLTSSFKRKRLWQSIEKIKRRKVTPKQLAKNLEALENSGFSVEL